MVTQDKDVAVAGQRGEVFGNLAHRDMQAAGETADVAFENLADIQQQGLPRVGIEQLAGGGDRDFQGNGGAGHGRQEEPRRERAQMKLRPAGCGAQIRAMQCLGIDYGTRRIGLSYGDEIGVATPLPALVQSAPEQRWTALRDVVKSRRITDLVLGYPFNMDGTAGFKAKEVDEFAARLKAEFGLPVHLVDERLTSYEAESTIAKAKRREVRASGLVDSRAATIILQDYLDQKLPPAAAES